MSSWWFGNRNKVPQMPEGGPMAADGGGGGTQATTAGQTGRDQQLSSAERKAMEAYRFDSSALERAAEAAKTLERSSNYSTILLHNKILLQILLYFYYG